MTMIEGLLNYFGRDTNTHKYIPKRARFVMHR